MKKEVLILGVGRALQMILLFLNYRLITMVLPKHEVGNFFFLLSLTAISGLVLINPLGTWFNRTLHSLESSRKVKHQMMIVFLLIIGLAFLNFPIVGVLSFFFESLSVNWLFAAAIVTFYVAATSTNNTVVPVFNFFKQRHLFVFLTVASQALALLFAWYFGVKTENASMWLLGHSVGFALLAFVSLLIPVKVVKEDNVKSLPMPLLSQSAWGFAWPVAIVNIAIWSMTQGYRPFLEKFAGLEILAEVGLGLGLASALAVAFEYLVQQVYQPDFYQASHSDSEKAWRKLAEKSLTHYLEFCIFLALIAKFALPILADEKFEGAALYFMVGAAVEWLRMSTNLISLKAHGDLKTRRLIQPYLISGAILFVGLTLTVFSSQSLPYLLLVSLIVSYLFLIQLVSGKNNVKTSDLLGFAGQAKSYYLFPLVIASIFVPDSWSKIIWNCFLVIGIFGGLFLWRQYRLIIHFESSAGEE